MRSRRWITKLNGTTSCIECWKNQKTMTSYRSDHVCVVVYHLIDRYQIFVTEQIVVAITFSLYHSGCFHHENELILSVVTQPD